MSSPLDRMIDEACGITPAKREELAKIARETYINLRCPKCNRKTTTKRDKTDPKSAVVLLVPCQKCFPKVRSPESVWLDALGRQVKKKSLK